MNFSRAVLAGILSGVLGHAQVPEIYSIDPRSARAGDVVTIRGQDFDPAGAEKNVVHFGGVKAKVFGWSIAQLTVEVPRGVQAGFVTITTGGFTAQSPAPFFPLFPPFGPDTNVSFASRPIFIGEGSGRMIRATADFDGDGDAELLCVGSQGGIYVYNERDQLLSPSSFRRAVPMLLSPSANLRLSLVDFDSDGRIDIFGTTLGFVLWSRNVHDSGELNTNSFLPLVSIPIPPLFPTGIETADFDRDGRVDLALTTSSGVSFLKNIYDPNVTNLLLASAVLAGPERPATDLAVGDLNRDGAIDLVVLSPPEILVYSHQDRRGNLTSNSFEILALNATNVTAIEVGDIEGDGCLDILTFARPSGEFTVLWNQNSGSALAAEDFRHIRLVLNDTVSTSPRLIDLNGDGFPDIVPQAGYIALNISGLVPDIIFSRTFAPGTNSLGFLSSGTLIVADFNADGAIDLGRESSVLQNILSIREMMVEARRIQEGILLLTVTGKPGATPQVQSSFDLGEWMSVSTGVRISSSGTGSFTVSPTENHRFYRIEPK